MFSRSGMQCAEVDEPDRRRRLPGMLPALLLVGCSLLAVALATDTPRAAEPPQVLAEVRIARLHYGGGGDWYCDPSSLPNWLEFVASRTGLPAAPTEVAVTLDSEDLYRYPLLYVSGHGRIALTENELEELRRYLDAGGFLYADDNYGLDPSFRALIEELYPDRELVKLGSDHPIYHCYYDLPGLPKIHQHDGEPAQGYGVMKNDRLVIFYSYSSDIGDGLEDPGVHRDPPETREAAARMAVNILVYALTHP